MFCHLNLEPGVYRLIYGVPFTPARCAAYDRTPVTPQRGLSRHAGLTSSNPLSLPFAERVAGGPEKDRQQDAEANCAASIVAFRRLETWMVHAAQRSNLKLGVV